MNEWHSTRFRKFDGYTRRPNPIVASMIPSQAKEPALIGLTGMVNLGCLFFAQIIFVSGSVLFVTMGGIIGSTLATDPKFATLPLSLLVLGTAAATIPAALLMRRVGRRAGFVFAASLGAASAWFAAQALIDGDFMRFCAGAVGIGMSMAFSQQFRFAAAENVTADRVSQAVSFILLGSVAAAFLGPALAAMSDHRDPDSPFHLALSWLVWLYLAAAAVCLLYRDKMSNTDAGNSPTARKLSSIVLQPAYLLALLAGVVGQGVMTFIMTAAPLSMHAHDGYSLAETSNVIRAHVLAMFLPSLVSGVLVAQFGVRRMMMAGVLCLLTTVVIGTQGQAYLHYWWAMVLLGLGWNLLYIGGTTLLVTTYSASERFGAQAVNEFSVFGMSAAASLGAGALMHAYGWASVLVISLPAIIAVIAALAFSRRVPTT